MLESQAGLAGFGLLHVGSMAASRAGSALLQAKRSGVNQRNSHEGKEGESRRKRVSVSGKLDK